MKGKGIYQVKSSEKEIKEYTLSVLTEDKLPPNFPIGVLVPSQINASDIKFLLGKLII